MSGEMVTDTIDHTEIVSYIDSIRRSECRIETSPEFTFLIFIEDSIGCEGYLCFRRRDAIDRDGLLREKISQSNQESRS